MLPIESQIARAVEILRAGGLVAYPTDTLYGLGAHAYLESAVAAVFSAKGRARSQGLPILIAAASQLTEVASAVPDLALRLAAVYWPGSLTIVLKRGPQVPLIVTGGQATVAVRVPAYPVPLEIIRRLGAPITGTSANKSGAASPATAQQVQEQLGDAVQLIIDTGPCPVGQPSTLVDLTTPQPRLLRAGAVALAELQRRFPDQRWETAPSGNQAGQ